VTHKISERVLVTTGVTGQLLAVLSGASLLTNFADKRIGIILLLIGFLGSLLSFYYNYRLTRGARRIRLSVKTRFSMVSPYALQLNSSLHDFDTEKPNPYVARSSQDVNGRLASLDKQAVLAMREHKPILIVEGERLAGTTRFLFNNAIDCCSDSEVFMIEEWRRHKLTEMVEFCEQFIKKSGDYVLWVERITPAQLKEINRSFIDDLPSNMRVFATLATEDYKDRKLFAETTNTIHNYAARIRIGAVSDLERKTILKNTRYTELAPMINNEHDDLLMGELMGSLELIKRVIVRDNNHLSRMSRHNMALLSAVSDWGRLAMPDQLSRKLLKSMYEEYWHEDEEPKAPMPDMFAEVLRWATGKQLGLYRPLVYKQINGGYSPHPLLSKILEESFHYSVSNVLWKYIETNASVKEKLDKGLAAYQAGQIYWADRLLYAFPYHTISGIVSTLIAMQLETQGHLENAARWFKKIVDAETDDESRYYLAAHHLGHIRLQQHRYDESKNWYEQAVLSQDPYIVLASLLNLGKLYQHRLHDGHKTAKHYYKKAIKNGRQILANLPEKSAAPTYYAYVSRQDMDDSTEPQRTLRPIAKAYLGLAELDPNPKKRYEWHRKAAETDDPTAGVLSMISAFMHDNDERWLERACRVSEVGSLPQIYSYARYMYASYLSSVSDEESNEKIISLYELAAESENIEIATASLFSLAGRTTDTHMKEGYYLRAVKAYGKIDHAHVRDYDEATKDVSITLASYPFAYVAKSMCNLGYVYANLQRLDLARYWLTRATKMQDREAIAKAFLRLGDIASGLNGINNPSADYISAREYYSCAIDMGYAEITPYAKFCLAILSGKRDMIRLLKEVAKAEQKDIRLIAKHKLERIQWESDMEKLAVQQQIT